jgi:signal transduction histidine kinase
MNSELSAKVKSLSEENDKLLKEIQFYKNKYEKDNLSVNESIDFEHKSRFFFYDNLNIGLFLYNKDLHVFYINNKGKEILNIKENNNENYSLRDFSDEMLVQTFEKALVGHESFFEGNYNINTNLPELLVSIKTKKININENEICGLALIEDITEQRQVENAIFKGYDIFQKVTDNVNELIFVIDPINENIIFLNRNAMNLFYDKENKSEKEIEKRNKILLNFYIKEKLNSKEIFETVDHEYFEPETKRWYQVTASKIYWIDTNEVVLISSTDISEQKEAERLITEQNQELENQTIELEKALLQLTEQNVQINSQAELLRSTNDTKDKMFSIIGHDLRGPVGNLKNALDLLIEEYDELNRDEVRDFIETLRESSDSVFNLLANLFEWAKSQSGRIVFRPEELSLNEIVEENISLFTPNFYRKNLTVSHNPVKEFTLFADENMLNTIVRNLISNSIKFTPENGNIKIIINDFVKSNKNYIELIVEDNGIGIEKENLVKIFNTTEHFSTYGTNNEKGSGLGIILCKEFVERHKGEISIKSEINKGTSITVVIPVN